MEPATEPAFNAKPAPASAYCSKLAVAMPTATCSAGEMPEEPLPPPRVPSAAHSSRLPPSPPPNVDHEGITRSLRDAPPAHYIFKIEAFSLLVSTEVEKYGTGSFDAGGWKWRLSLYPNGNKRRDGNGYLSLYLVLEEPGSLPPSWEINVDFKFFLYDQIRDKYLTIQDSGARAKRFHGLKTEWGFDKLISLSTFEDESKGFLIGDCCVFGAEVFVVKNNGRGECLSMVKIEPPNGLYTWKITGFSTKDWFFSDAFTVGGRKWKLLIYPKGDSKGTPMSISFYILLDASETLPSKRKLYAKYKLRIKNQFNNNHHEFTESHWFSAPGRGRGVSAFIPQSTINDISKGFLINDTLIAEGEIMVMSAVKDF
ncbi:uncharacterized protein LOC131159801 [Malania oleifera]|uniref:uncharacterized protein LOC131159801 n=1 Tax=Malania oleifera TaxID=397392 RepID=UPI0025AE4375|nr:uncharacterized protein LOC131159801 [Malania oleifera]